MNCLLRHGRSDSWISLVLLALATMNCFSAKGEGLELVSNRIPQCLFAGSNRTVTVMFRNSSTRPVKNEMRVRILQASFATAAPVSERAWKALQVLPEQTILESASADFPAVRAETRFLVQWIAESNHVLGETDVWVYPTNLLGELKILLEENVLGVLDPENEIKPLLQQAGIDFVDLGNVQLENFRGKLAIIGPFHSSETMAAGLSIRVQALVKNGVAVLWFQPPAARRDLVKPSFYVVTGEKGTLVAAQAELVAQPAENPQSQVNLVYLSKLALQPALLRFFDCTNNGLSEL